MFWHPTRPSSQATPNRAHRPSDVFYIRRRYNFLSEPYHNAAFQSAVQQKRFYEGRAGRSLAHRFFLKTERWRNFRVCSTEPDSKVKLYAAVSLSSIWKRIICRCWRADIRNWSLVGRFKSDGHLFRT